VKTKTRVLSLAPAAMLMLASLVGGCNILKIDKFRFLAPEKVVARPDRPAVGPIRDSISILDQSQEQELLPNAVFPDKDDLEYSDEDYIIGPTDVLDISILDLFQEGLETPLRRQVSESGFIDLPQLPERIKASGLNKEQLKEAISQAYSPDILKDPIVSVTIAGRRQNTFSVLGAIARPGTYSILRPDMRLLQGLAMPGDITQSGIDYIYVIRQRPPTLKPKVEKAPDIGKLPEMVIPELKPQSAPAGTRPAGTAPAKEGPPPRPASSPSTGSAKDLEKALKELGGLAPGGAKQTQPVPSVVPMLTETATTASKRAGSTTTSRPEMPTVGQSQKWIYSNGRWIRVTQETPAVQKPAPRRTLPAKVEDVEPEVAKRPTPTRPATPTDPFGWKKALQSESAKVIAINLRQLRNGDPRMNIVLRDNDVIYVPTLEVGEFYVAGEVARPGVYSLTGRKITIKQALTAAGNLGPLAWPENAVLVRRIGPNQEQAIPINIEAIFNRQEPDIFLKPNDVIEVGTSAVAPFLAVMRNAFRMTYGFGFIYDRNFADPLTVTPKSNRFKAW